MPEAYDPQQSGGPFLLVACLCENVVQRADGVLTLVNIVDRVNITTRGTEAPPAMPAVPYQIHLVLVLKAGRARGRYDLRVELELPDFTKKPPAVMSVNFEGEDDRGIQIIQQMNMSLGQEGLHWFNLYLVDKLLTRLPLRVIYSRITGGTTR